MTQRLPQQHAPGPWTVVAGEVFAMQAGWQGYRVARAMAQSLDTGSHAPAVAEANARLIAAAPDLLAALRAIVEGGSWHDDGSFVYYPPDDGEDAISEAEAIIAKAEGRA